MLKGCQREMIVMQTLESALFESAYFVLRPRKAAASSGDMLAEANRIIGEGNGYLERRRARRCLFPFFLGVLCGALLFALFAWIIS